MDTAAVLGEVLALCNGAQYRHDGGTIEPLKRAAKRVATDLLNARLPAGSRILDVGGEAFYHGDLAGHELTVANLPDRDMHEIRDVAAFDAILAMHVLEHSPVPLLVLRRLHRALVPGGLLYAAVPHPSPRIMSGYGHWTIMPPAMWRRLLEAAGFVVERQTTGKMGARADWIEERFCCRRAR